MILLVLESSGLQWRIPDFSGGGGLEPLRGTLTLAIFPEKLHENEEIFCPVGARPYPPLPLLRSSMAHPFFLPENIH